MMRKEKRNRRAVAYLHPSMYEQLELFAAERGGVISVSDYLFELVERHIGEREYVQLSKQKIAARVGKN